MKFAAEKGGTSEILGGPAQGSQARFVVQIARGRLFSGTILKMIQNRRIEDVFGDMTIAYHPFLVEERKDCEELRPRPREVNLKRTEEWKKRSIGRSGVRQQTNIGVRGVRK